MPRAFKRENTVVEGNFSSFTSDLFLQLVVDSNRLNRITFDCFVSENSTRILLNVLMGGKLLTKYFLNLNLGEKELLKVCEIYSLKK